MMSIVSHPDTNRAGNLSRKPDFGWLSNSPSLGTLLSAHHRSHVPELQIADGLFGQTLVTSGIKRRLKILDQRSLKGNAPRVKRPEV